MNKLILIATLSILSFTASAMPPFHHIPNYANVFAVSTIPKEDLWMFFAVPASFALFAVLTMLINLRNTNKSKK